MAAPAPQQSGQIAEAHSANGINEEGDPFTIDETPTRPPQSSLRHSSFDTQLFALNHPSSSPSQARKALEAHLAETDRRIQETSQLGTTLVQQRSNLSQRLRDVEIQGEGENITPELREKLKQIEREFQEVGRQSAKTFLGPRAGSPASGETSNAFALDGRVRTSGLHPYDLSLTFVQNTASPTKFSSQATDSPSKVQVPRKQRNQASNNENLDFAAEITTSLLGQVRHLQAVLAERDDTLKSMSAEKSKLELDAEGFAQRLKHLDDNEQRYKDENWNLETQLQELQAAQREAANKENKLQQALAASTTQHSTAQRELDDLKQNHGKLTEEHTMIRKNHESELAALRKNVNLGESEKTALQRKLDEVTQQNQELAKGLAHGFKAQEAGPLSDHDTSLDEDSLVLSEREASPPPSPTKGGQRHSMLESETLKSSLNHAHRMIQNLKGNVHREKSEKNDLKRMLQEARDELEIQRAEPDGKRARSKSQHNTNRGTKAGLGAVRNSRTDIVNDPTLNDPAWEDHNDSPKAREAAIRASKPFVSTPLGDSSDAYQTANETEGFETANERDTTDNDAFETGAEDMAGASTDELTETEGVARSETVRGKKPAPLAAASLATAKAGNRNSIQSTASTSDDDDEKALYTPIQGQPQRFRLKMNRNSRRSRTGSGIVESSPSTTQNSPASFVNGPGDVGQSLAAELEGISGDEEGTPSKGSISSPRSAQSLRRSLSDKRSSRSLKNGSQPGTPGLRPSTLYDSDAPPVPRIPTVDSGMMTEPWEATFQTSNNGSQGTPKTFSSSIIPTAAAASITNRIFGSSPATPQNKNVTQAADGSVPHSTSTSTSTPPRPVWDQPLNMFNGNIPGMGQSAHSTPLSSRTTSGQVRDAPEDGRVADEQKSETFSGATPRGLPATAKESQQPPLSLSPIRSLETTPIQSISDVRRSVVPIVPAKSRPHQAQDSGSGSILGSVFGWRRSTSGTPTPQIAEDDSSRDVAPPTSTDDKGGKKPLHPVHAKTSPQSPETVQKSAVEPKPMPIYNSESSQTILSSEQIDQMLVAKAVQTPAQATQAMPPLASIGAVSPPSNQQQFKPEVRIPEGSITGTTPAKSYKDLLGQGVKRPTSVSSIRSRTAQYPPLPPDHQEAIAAAAEKTTQIMGPPLAPASAYPSASTRSRRASRPQTPSHQSFPSPSSKGGTTPRAGRYSTTRSQVSRRSSVSSFASELDERFNIRTDGMPMPQGFQGNTDPRMIQAITQTMIGEMMWKYTRKAGRGEMSNTRHRRFFWVHPYTRTLYWSDRDPASANRAELKSKSVAIEAVRVVTDDNPMPPGLHRKSLIIVTPGRSVKLTAQTSQRHTTWFNALSYLLLRTGTDGAASNNAGGDLTEADVDEFNPQVGANRRSTRSRISMSSFKSNATADRNLQNSLSSRVVANSFSGHTQTLPKTAESEDERTTGSIRKRISRSLSRKGGRQASQATGKQPEQYDTVSGSVRNPTATNTSNSRRSSISSANKPLHASIGSRISNYWKPADPALPSRDSVRSRGSRAESMVEPGVLEGGRSVVSLNRGNDSAEDVRRVIEEREARGDLENVRACCDGQFD